MKIFNKITGSQGEAIAQKFLKDQGYKILATNFTCKIGEIDIIAQQKKTLFLLRLKQNLV